TAYHRWAWRRVFGDVFGHEPLYLSARDDSGIVGVLPLVAFKSRLFGRFLCSLPFVNYGGMLIAGTADRGPSTGDRLPGTADRTVVGRRLPVASGALGAALRAKATGLGRARGAAHVELRHTERPRPDAPVRQHKVTMWLTLADS